MNEKGKDKKIQKLLAVLLVLLIAALSVFNAQKTGAVDKTLAVDTGHYVRWRRGLPPEDGNWHRALLLANQHQYGNRVVLRGNDLLRPILPSVYTIDDPEDPNNYSSRNPEITMVAADPSLVRPYDGTLFTNDQFLPEISSDKWNDEVIYTQDYLNTPALRFVGYDSKNNHDAPAPRYQLQLSDWSSGGGKLTGQILTPGDEMGETDYAGFVQGGNAAWTFVGREHDTDVDYAGMYVIEKYRKGFQNILTMQQEYKAAYDKECWEVTSGPFGAGTQFIVYWGDEIVLDTIADGQVIEEDEIVNITGNNYLTLAAGSTLTIKDGGILSVGSGLFNDGTIRVEKGGTLIIREDAFLMPWATNSGNGNVICDGGDVIVYSGGKLVCEGVSGFKMSGADNNYSTVYNYGLIMATNLTLQGKARSVHNEGSIVVGWVVEPRYAQTFRDKKISPKGADISAIPGLKTKGHITYDVGSGVITGYTSPLVY